MNVPKCSDYQNIIWGCIYVAMLLVQAVKVVIEPLTAFSTYWENLTAQSTVKTMLNLYLEISRAEEP